MNKVQLAAIVKAGEEAARLLKASGGLSAGHYEVSLALKIAGEIKKGDDYSQVVNESLPWERLALSLANRVNDETLNAVLRDLSEVDAKPLKARVLSAWEAFRKSATQACSGKTTAKIVWG